MADRAHRAALGPAPPGGSDLTRPAGTPPLEFATIDDVIAALRERGGRLSASRRAVLEALFAADAPVSAEAVASQRRLELTSVYRALEALELLGAVRHVHLGHGPGLYALTGGDPREYLLCERCGRVTAVASAALDGVREEILRCFGHTASFSHFPIAGRCAACAQADDARRR